MNSSIERVSSTNQFGTNFKFILEICAFFFFLFLLLLFLFLFRHSFNDFFKMLTNKLPEEVDTLLAKGQIPIIDLAHCGEYLIEFIWQIFIYLFNFFVFVLLVLIHIWMDFSGFFYEMKLRVVSDVKLSLIHKIKNDQYFFLLFSLWLDLKWIDIFYRFVYVHSIQITFSVCVSLFFSYRLCFIDNSHQFIIVLVAFTL